MAKEDKIVEEAICYIRELFKDNSDGHDAEHSLRVHKNAIRIAKDYQDCNLLIVELASLLHDADDHKLFNTENNMNARRFLQSHGIESKEIDLICEIINGVSFSKNRGVTPKTLEGKIVQDSDRLDAIGAIGIARTFAYGGKADSKFGNGGNAGKGTGSGSNGVPGVAVVAGNHLNGLVPGYTAIVGGFSTNYYTINYRCCSSNWCSNSSYYAYTTFRPM